MNGGVSEAHFGRPVTEERLSGGYAGLRVREERHIDRVRHLLVAGGAAMQVIAGGLIKACQRAQVIGTRWRLEMPGAWRICVACDTSAIAGRSPELQNSQELLPPTQEFAGRGRFACGRTAEHLKSIDGTILA